MVATPADPGSRLAARHSVALAKVDVEALHRCCAHDNTPSVVAAFELS